MSLFVFAEKAPDVTQEVSFLRPLMHSGFWYQKAVKAGFRSPRNNYVAVVLINDPTLLKGGSCLAQSFIAKLLTVIQNSSPAVVVVDAAFTAEGCPAERDTTIQGQAALQKAMSESSQRSPIVFAHAAYDWQQLQHAFPDEISNLKRQGLKENQLLLGSSIDFGENENGQISWGLYEANKDVRKIPLSWGAYCTTEPIAHHQPNKQNPLTLDTCQLPTGKPTLVGTASQKPSPVTLDTLPVKAIKAYLPDPRILTEIAKMQAEYDPFTSFLQRDELASFSAIDLLCGTSSNHSTNWQLCQTQDADKDILRRLHHRVVLIGFDLPDKDQHESVIGDVPGVILIANYIESLLDSRFFEPLPGGLWTSISLTLIWFAIIEVILSFSPTLTQAYVYALFATGVMWLFVYDLVVIQFGYYLVLWPPTLLAIACRLLDDAGRKLIHRIKHEPEKESKK